MARNVAFFPVEPEHVFAVLADPSSYGHWVVGSATIRDADPGWPAPGTKFHHRVGIGPIGVNDNTEVLEVEPPHRLVLEARARPLGTARVVLELVEHDGGTRVTMLEAPSDRITRRLHNPLFDKLIALRNTESLRRLGRLAEEHAARAAGAAPVRA